MTVEARPFAPKRASAVAIAIENEIMAAGWPVGTVLGSEAELLERFEVSRAVLREAIRIVEHSGVAAMRRGPGGGLVVTEPDFGAVASAAAVWFASVGVTVAEMFDALRPLRQAACELAAERIDETGAARLLAMIDDLEASDRLAAEDFTAIDALISDLAGNPAIRLFERALAQIAVSFVGGTRAKLDPPLGSSDAQRHLRAYHRLAEAVVAGDASAARHRMERILDALGSRLVDRPVRPRRRAVDLSAGDGRGKLAERLANTMQSDIERHGWLVGEAVGSEAGLLEEYGVSRAVLREAVRILEHHRAVRTKRGPGGGLFVDQPDGAAIARAAVLFLSFEGVDLPQLLEARSCLELTGVKLAAERCNETVAADLRQALEDEPVGSTEVNAFHEIHHHLARASRSRPLALFVSILADITSLHVPPRRRSAEDQAAIWAEVERAHRAIVAAVIAGDVPTAQRRMKRHLDATIAYLG